MAIQLSTFATQLLNTIPEADTELTATVRNQMIKQAVFEYGRDKPKVTVDDVTGDGGKYYPLTGGGTVASAWSDRFSQITRIEYPAVTIASDQTPVYLDNEDYEQDHEVSGVKYLWLPHHAPAASETIRIAYTSLYTWTTGTTTTNVSQPSHGFSVNDYVYQDDDSNETWTAAGAGEGDLLATHIVTTVTDSDNIIVTELAIAIPEVDFFAICYKAACIACYALAEKFSRSSDALIRADSVNHISKAGEFENRAKAYCKLYSDHIAATGGDSADGKPMGYAEFVDIDTFPRFPNTSRRYLHHDRANR